MVIPEWGGGSNPCDWGPYKMRKFGYGDIHIEKGRVNMKAEIR